MHAKTPGRTAAWSSYEKPREVIQKRMFSRTEDLLPVISLVAFEQGERSGEDLRRLPPQSPSRSQGGVAVTVEFVLSEDRPTAMLRATFALAVLVLTTKGDACTFARLKEIVRARRVRAEHVAGARTECAGHGDFPEVTAQVSSPRAA